MSALWTLPLPGVPCWVCMCPATMLVVYPEGRVVHHADGRRPCTLPNPPAPAPRVPGPLIRRTCPACNRQIGLRDRRFVYHLRNGHSCPATATVPPAAETSREAVA